MFYMPKNTLWLTMLYLFRIISAAWSLRAMVKGEYAFKENLNQWNKEAFIRHDGFHKLISNWFDLIKKNCHHPSLYKWVSYSAT